MQTETRAYIITMTINTAQCTCKHLYYSLDRVLRILLRV